MTTSSRTWWLKELIKDSGAMTVSEVADTFSVSHATIRRLIKNKTVVPSKQYRVGKYFVYLFSPEDVRKLREHFEQRITTTN